VNIDITDITGRLLCSMDKENVAPGSHVFDLSRDQFASGSNQRGVFIVTVKTGDGSSHFKVIAGNRQ
jgi:hypothetical protein